MSDIRIVRDYPHPPVKVWRAVPIQIWSRCGRRRDEEAGLSASRPRSVPSSSS
jgi:hypothetical protein